MDWTQILIVFGVIISILLVILLVKWPQEKMGKPSLRDLTNKQLLSFLEENEKISFGVLVGICSEVLRRMNEIDPVLKDDLH